MKYPVYESQSPIADRPLTSRSLAFQPVFAVAGSRRLNVTFVVIFEEFQNHGRARISSGLLNLTRNKSPGSPALRISLFLSSSSRHPDF
jgi:hypothetical protein